MTTPELTETERGQGRARFPVYAMIFLASLAPLLVSPILPTIDFYDHIARHYVLAHLHSEPFLAQNYEPRWAILPNIGLDLIGTALATFVPARVLAKLLTVAIFAVQFFGLLYFNRKLTGRNSVLVALFGAALLYSFIFTWGFGNFLLGLGLTFWGAGWWLATRDRMLLAVPTACAIALLIFITHGFAFGLYGLLLGGLEIGLFLQSRPRSIARLARQMAALAAQAVAPALLFRASATVKATEGVTNADEAVKRLAENGGLFERLGDLAVHRIATVARVSEGPNLWLDVVTNMFLFGAAVFLVRRGRASFAPAAWPVVAIGVALFLVVPPALFGVGYVGDRIPLFVALLAAGALVVKPAGTRTDSVIVSLVAVVVAVKVAALAGSWLPYRADYAAYEKVRAAIPPHQVVAYSNFANLERLDTRPRCEMYGPLLVAAGHATPLFAIPTAQPFALIGRLQAAMHARPPKDRNSPKLQLTRDRFEAVAQAGQFDYILACDPGRVGIAPATGRTLVAQEGRFALFKLAPPPTAPAP